MLSIDDMFLFKNALNSPTNSVKKNERKTEAEYKGKRKGEKRLSSQSVHLLRPLR